MVEVEHEGNVYRFERDRRTNRGYWIGIRGRRSPMFSGPYYRIPLAYNLTLTNKAVEDGFDKEIFYPKVEKKKAKTARAKAKKKNGISIF